MCTDARVPPTVLRLSTQHRCCHSISTESEPGGVYALLHKGAVGLAGGSRPRNLYRAMLWRERTNIIGIHLIIILHN